MSTSGLFSKMAWHLSGFPLAWSLNRFPRSTESSGDTVSCAETAVPASRSGSVMMYANNLFIFGHILDYQPGFCVIP